MSKEPPIVEKIKKRKRITSANTDEVSAKNICINKECKLRKQGCKGFEGCPGYKTL